MVRGEAAGADMLAGENGCGGLKCFVSINVKLSDLEGPVCWLSVTRKEVGCLLVCCCCPLVDILLC